MASKDPFNIAHSPIVAPIPCIECGNNMHCVRRQPTSSGEKQRFLCSCKNSVERFKALEMSDDQVQRHVEDSLGIGKS